MMSSYIRGFITLFLLLTALLHLSPGKNYQKYIRFFVELVLTIALISPILSIVCDSEEFLKLVNFEEYTEALEELSNDMHKMEYLYSDYHKAAYEKAIAEDVRLIAESQNFFVKDVSVQLSNEYMVEHIALWVSRKEEEQIVVRRVELEQTREELGTMICLELQQELIEFYQLEEEQIEIHYDGRTEGVE